MTMQTSFVVTFTHDESVTFHVGMLCASIKEQTIDLHDDVVGIVVQDAEEWAAVRLDQAIDTANIMARMEGKTEGYAQGYAQGYSQGYNDSVRVQASMDVVRRTKSADGQGDQTPWN